MKCSNCRAFVRRTFFAQSAPGFPLCPSCWGKLPAAEQHPPEPFQLIPPPRIAEPPSSDEWYTPAWFLQLLRGLDLDLDPCSDRSRDTPCRAHVVGADGGDGLAIHWTRPDGTPARVWMNPPYSNTASWCEKAWREVSTGRAELVVGLIPFRPEGYWHESIWPRALVGHPKRRIAFEHPRGVASSTSGRFPSAIVIWCLDQQLEQLARRIITCGFLRHRRELVWCCNNVWR